jgi:hypothetical protein
MRIENIADKCVRKLKLEGKDDALCLSIIMDALEETSQRIKINRAWAMPSKHTFLIPPIKKLVYKYVGNGIGWIDPFAGENSPAELTNDLNPNKPAKYHLHAKDFSETIEGKYKGVLLDPPYSLTQVKQCYEEIGVSLFQEDSQRFPQNVKEIIAPKIENNGYAITFGWNSQGFGKNLGFEIIEILMVAHGRSHNDTIVTVERKLPTIF